MKKPQGKKKHLYFSNLIFSSYTELGSYCRALEISQQKGLFRAKLQLFVFGLFIDLRTVRSVI